MRKGAADIERDIRQRWLSRTLRARGLWLTIRDLIERTDMKRPGHLFREDGRPMRPQDVAIIANVKASVARSLIDSLTSVELLAVADDGTIHSPILARLFHARAANARKQRNHRNKGEDTDWGLHNPQMGVTYPHSNPPCNHHPPPMVSPPITPSSFPPDLHISAGGNETGSPVTSEHRQAAHAAFDLWARRRMDRPLDAARNEHRVVSDLLESVAQEPPIVRNGEQVARHLLVPEAAASCNRNGKDFKGVRYACQTVRSTLDEWALKGVPGASAAQVEQRRPVNRPLATAKVFDPEAAR